MLLIPWSKIHENCVLIKLVYAYGVNATRKKNKNKNKKLYIQVLIPFKKKIGGAQNTVI